MSTERTEPTAQSSTTQYRKLSDFMHPPQEHFPETQEIAVLPRMKLPTINMNTGESIVPWIAVWSNKNKEPSDITHKSMEQTPYTPIPRTLSDIETIHLPTAQYLPAALQPDKRINTFVYAENETPRLTESSPKKSRPKSLWKNMNTFMRRFRIRTR